MQAFTLYMMGKFGPVDFVNACILTSCLVFVAYMTSVCFDNYLKHPQGAKIVMKKIHEEIMPQFTLCPLEELNTTILDQCGMKR